jgi:hypothetical protein
MGPANIPRSRGLIILLAALTLFFAACIANVVALGQVSAAESDAGTRQITFDIAAQPLAQALEVYGNVTGWEVLYNSNLAVDRRSSAVHGSFTPEAALRSLLAGTGLAAQYTDDKSVVLVSNATAVLPPVAGTTADTLAATRLNYFGLIQNRMRTALCADSDARAGHYRIAAQFWIGESGNVVRYQRLGSTGEAETDRRIDRRLRDLRIGSSPPQGFAEPVTILVVPQAPDVTLSCVSDHAGLQSIKAGP